MLRASVSHRKTKSSSKVNVLWKEIHHLLRASGSELKRHIQKTSRDFQMSLECRNQMFWLKTDQTRLLPFSRNWSQAFLCLICFKFGGGGGTAASVVFYLPALKGETQLFDSERRKYLNYTYIYKKKSQYMFLFPNISFNIVLWCVLYFDVVTYCIMFCVALCAGVWAASESPCTRTSSAPTYSTQLSPSSTWWV